MRPQCKKLCILLAILFSISFSSRASNPKDSSDVKVRFAYDLDFDMLFDNREFYKSDFTRSMTVFGARLTPMAGVALEQGDGTCHRIMAGIDVMKDFGASSVPAGIAPSGSPELDGRLDNLNLFREISLFYEVRKSIGKTDLTLNAGVFPRGLTQGEYSPAFISDSLKFYDNNLEGILLKFKRPQSAFEVGCDWMGKQGKYRRERFMIFSSGEGQVLPSMVMGYSAYLYHFASSSVTKGVVDNALINPYLRFDLSGAFDMQALSFRLGWLQSLQNDRKNVGHYVFPGGAEVMVELQKWNLGIRNDLFVGVDMMPYYNSKDSGGYKYGSMLYMGSPFYRVYDDGTDGIGMTDRLEFYYSPRIGTPYLNLKISSLFYFNTSGYCGCRQMVSLSFNLSEMK